MTNFYKIHIATPPQASLPEAAQSTDTLSAADIASPQCFAAEEVQARDREVVPDRIAELQRLVEQLRDDIDGVRLEKQESKRQWDVVFALVTELTAMWQRSDRPRCSCADARR